MIQLEHINLVVSDIERALNFYRAAFPHWRVRDTGGGQWYGKPRKWLHFGDDYQYLAFNDYGEGENRDLRGYQMGLAHFAYVTDDLNGIMLRLQKAGYTPATEGAAEPFRRNIYYIDPAGFEVEFVQYLSDLPAQRNASRKLE